MFVMHISRVLLVLVLPTSQALDCLTVDTTTGLVQGSIDSISPNVAHFLGVPYAEQPVGARRWLPSTPAVRQHKVVIDATQFGPACPQLDNNRSTLWSVDAPQFGIIPSDYVGEDCLSVNIWAPWKKKRSKGLLPVIAWIHGGSFQTGGASVPYQNPSRWVERTGRHIVVGINYRLNIFGSPNAAGLKHDEQNLGLLDQRLAVEWIRDNIVRFGGDASRITLWGHSAGAVSVDSYSFAYPDDPIIAALIMSSGTAHSSIPFDTPDFTVVAEKFGCQDTNAAAEVDCLRNVKFTEIIAFLQARMGNETYPPLPFAPIVDNRTVFSNHTARALSGDFIRRPAMIGTTVNEFAAFLPYNRSFGPDQGVADYGTLGVFLCPSVVTTHERYAGGNATTFRYLYGGNFSNIAPQWWEGAYHEADMPLVFGTHSIARSESTSFQVEVSEQMQDYWLAFVEDPINGLPRLGWEGYSGKAGGSSMLIGSENEVTQLIADSELEKPCDGLVPNGRPKPPASCRKKSHVVVP